MQDDSKHSNTKNSYTDEHIADEIARIAYHIHKKNALENQNYPIIRRRELVKFLNQQLEGLQLTDTLRVNSLVERAYESSSGNVQNAILQIFKQNLGNDPVYDPNRIYPSNNVLTAEYQATKDFDKKLSILKYSSAAIDNRNAQILIEQEFDKAQAIIFKKGFLGVGNAGNAKDYGRKVLAGYEAMIQEYEVVKDVNLNLMSDFETLRNELKEQREDVVQLLLDLFGDRAKSEHPELFDLGIVNWYNFENSWKKLSLAHNKIEDDHKDFLQSIDVSLSKFGKDITQQANSSWKTLEKTAGKRDLNKNDLVAAGVGMAVTAGISAISGAIKARNKSKEVVATIQNDVERLKAEMFEDQRLILKDVFRLGKLYTKLSDSVLPNYHVFIKNNNERIERDFLPLYNQLIQNPIIRESKDLNNDLIKQRRQLDQQLRDYKSSTQYSENQIVELESLLGSLMPELELVEQLKPSKPWVIVSIISLGRSDKIYNNSLDLWNLYCKPIVDYYEHTKFQIKCEKENIINISKDIEDTQEIIIEITSSIKSNSDKIHFEFKQNPWSKEQILKMIDVIKSIINASRTVLEVKLDEEITQTAK